MLVRKKNPYRTVAALTQPTTDELPIHSKDDLLDTLFKNLFITKQFQLRWWLVGLVSGVCLSLLCLAICNLSYGKTSLSMVSSHHKMDELEMNTELMRMSNEALDRYEYHFLGILVEGIHEWRGFRPAEYHGIPGGRWTLCISVLVLCSLLSFLPVLLEKWRTKEIESTGKE